MSTNDQALARLRDISPTGTAPLTDLELDLLRRARCQREWDAAATAIQGARGGHWPPDWFARVIRSRLHERVVAGWISK